MEAAGSVNNDGEEDTTLDFNITFEDSDVEEVGKMLSEDFGLDSTGPQNFSYHELGETASSNERSQPALKEKANDLCVNLAVSPDVAEELLKLLGEDGSNHEQVELSYLNPSLQDTIQYQSAATLKNTQLSTRKMLANDASILNLPNSSQFMNFGVSSSANQWNLSIGATQPYLPSKEKGQPTGAGMQRNDGSVLNALNSSQFADFRPLSSTPSMRATQPCLPSGEQWEPGFSGGGNESHLMKQTGSSALFDSLLGNFANVGQSGWSFYRPVSPHQTIYPSMKGKIMQNGVIQPEHEANWMNQQNQFGSHTLNAYQNDLNLSQQMARTNQVAAGSTVCADQFIQNSIANNNMMDGTSSSNIYVQAPLCSSSYSQNPSKGFVDGTTSSCWMNQHQHQHQQQQEQPSWASLNQNVPYAPWIPTPLRPSLHNQYMGGNNAFDLQTGNFMLPAGAAGPPSMRFRPQTSTNQLQLHNKVPLPEFTNPFDSQYHNYSIPHFGVGHYLHPRASFDQFPYASSNAYDYDPRSYNSMLTEPSLSTRIPRQFSNYHQHQLPPKNGLFSPYNSMLPGQASSSSSSRRRNSIGSNRQLNCVRAMPNALQCFYSTKADPSFSGLSKDYEELLGRPAMETPPNPILDTSEKTLNLTSETDQESGGKNKEASDQATVSERSESINEPSKENKKKKKVFKWCDRSKKFQFELGESSSASSAKSSKDHDTPRKKSRTGERDHQPAASTILKQVMNKNSGNNQITAGLGVPHVTMSNPPRSENLVYNPLFESLGLPADPHLRSFAFM